MLLSGVSNVTKIFLSIFKVDVSKILLLKVSYNVNVAVIVLFTSEDLLKSNKLVLALIFPAVAL